MFIKSLSIRNFRNFKASKFQFVRDSVNTILGENASGKTNIFHAMRLVLDDSLPLNARFLESKDFNRDIGEIRGHWIVIQFRFSDLGKSDEALVLANHAVEGEQPPNEGTYTFVYRPKAHVRQQLHNFSISIEDRQTRLEAVNDYLKSIIIGKDDYEIVAFTRTMIDFFDDDAYKKLAGDFDEAIFPDPTREDAQGIGVSKPAQFSLIREVTCTYVKALRNVVNDLRYTKTNPLYRLLSYKSTEITGADSITESVKNLNKDISDLEQVKDLSQNIAKTLSDAVGHTYSPDIKITSDVPEEIEELVQSLSLIVEDSIGYQGTGNIKDISLGGANLIYLALKLYEYEMAQTRDDKIAHFLLIEEPEAHIHNHIQKTLFSNFQSLNTQVFISTHSTQISSVSKISSMNVISRIENYSDVFWPSNNLEPEEVSGIERYLDAVRSTLLFAKSIILVEGDAEQILIPALVKAVLGISLDEMGISLISMDGTVFTHISSLFHKDRIRNYCSILTDRDAAYLTEPNEYADADAIKRLTNADANGEARQQILSAHCDDNPYLATFFAQNTFETELILAGNTTLFTKVLPRIYTQKAKIQEILEFIVTGDNPRKCHTALKLAQKVGKGWFAIKLSDFVMHDTIIPEYILQSIAHALRGHAADAILLKIMEYRFSVLDTQSQDLIDTVENDVSVCKKAFRDKFPQDPLAKIIAAI